MASSRRMALGLAWVVARGRLRRLGGGGAPDSKLARAERSLQAELEEAADHLGMAAEPGERVSPTRCDAGPRQEVTSGYRIRLRLSGDREQVLRQAASFWRRRGHRVRVSAPTGASRPSSRPPIRAGRSRSSSSRTGRGAALRRHAVPA